MYFSKDQRGADPILRYFEFSHLPPHLQATSRAFCDTASNIVSLIPRNAERTVALRKLLEAKDAAVRASLPKIDEDAEPLDLVEFPVVPDEEAEPREIGGHDIDVDGPPPFS